jgi:CRISPR-associated protein Cas1
MPEVLGRFSLNKTAKYSFDKSAIKTDNIQKAIEKHFDKNLNYALLNEEGKKIFIDAFETRINETFMHPKLKRKITYKHCLKLEGYKLIKYIVEKKEFVPFRLKDKM